MVLLSALSLFQYLKPNILSVIVLFAECPYPLVLQIRRENGLCFAILYQKLLEHLWIRVSMRALELEP